MHGIESKHITGDLAGIILDCIVPIFLDAWIIGFGNTQLAQSSSGLKIFLTSITILPTEPAAQVAKALFINVLNLPFNR